MVCDGPISQTPSPLTSQTRIVTATNCRTPPTNSSRPNTRNGIRLASRWPQETWISGANSTPSSPSTVLDSMPYWTSPGAAISELTICTITITAASPPTVNTAGLICAGSSERSFFTGWDDWGDDWLGIGRVICPG